MKINFRAQIQDLGYVETTLRILNNHDKMNETQLNRLVRNVREIQELFEEMESVYGKGYVELLY